MMPSKRDVDTLQYVEHSVLQTDEKIVWKGKPDPKAAGSIGLFKFLFGIFFFGFAVFWTVTASAGGGYFGLFGIPFLCAGAWMLSSPIRNYMKAFKTYYAVTTERVLIVVAGGHYKTVSIYPQDITDYERKEKPAGTGNILLRKTENRRRRGTQTSVEYTDGLWGIQDIKGAADAIAVIQASAQ